MPFTAGVRAVASRHRLADAVKGGELSYMTLAMERDTLAYRSQPSVTGALLADPEPTPLRVVRGCIAMPFTAGFCEVALPSLYCHYIWMHGIFFDTMFCQ